MNYWNPVSILRCVMLAAVMVLAGFRGAAYGDARSVEEFVSQQENWERLAGTTWNIEGRYAVLGKSSMKFMNCDLQFVLADDLPRVPGQSNVIEVSGTLEKNRNQLQFRVTSWRPRPTDPETLRLKRASIDPLNPKHWYDLAEWARGRSRFYNDGALLSEALRLLGDGAMAEKRQLAADDSAGLLALADRASAMGVDSQLIQEFRHEAYRRMLAGLSSSPNVDFAVLQAEIARGLKGATDRYPDDRQELADAYRKDPLGTYRLTAAEDRLLLHRLVYIELTKIRMERMLDPEGRNGFEVARQIDLLAPELANLAEKYRDMQLDWQSAHIDTMTRQELFEFVQICQNRKLDDLAREARIKWIKAREPRLRADGARGLAELGEDWFSFLADEEGAAKYFIESSMANPDYVPASDWLTAHGFVFRNGKWLRESEAVAMATPRDSAIRDGRVEVGMTEQNIRAALGASPTSTFRMASAGRIIDLWVYDHAGIVVRLERKKGEAEAIVTSIDKIPTGRSGR